MSPTFPRKLSPEEQERESLKDAIIAGNVEIVKELLDKGINPNVSNYDVNFLHIAAFSKGSNGLKIMKLLLDHGGNINSVTKNMETPLMIAIHNNPEIAKFLIENGADVNMADNNGTTALMDAFSKNSVEIIKLLLDRGADINVKDINGYTILSFNVENYDTKPYSKEKVKMALENGADPFIEDKCPSAECKELLAKYRWERLKKRDKDTAKRYYQNTKNTKNNEQFYLPKEIWEIILLHKRQQMLCQNLNSDKNKEILYLFALELGLQVDKVETSKAKLCALISRYLTYGKDPSRQEKVERDMIKHRDIIMNMARLYGIDTSKPTSEILSQLSAFL